MHSTSFVNSELLMKAAALPIVDLNSHANKICIARRGFNAKEDLDTDRTYS